MLNLTDKTPNKVMRGHIAISESVFLKVDSSKKYRFYA